MCLVIYNVCSVCDIKLMKLSPVNKYVNERSGRSHRLKCLGWIRLTNSCREVFLSGTCAFDFKGWLSLGALCSDVPVAYLPGQRDFGHPSP